MKSRIVEGNKYMRRIMSFFKDSADRDISVGVLNQDGFEKVVRRELEQYPDNEYIMVVFDIDRFKELKNRYGEVRSEQLLLSIIIGIQEWKKKHFVFGKIAIDKFVLMTENTPDFMQELSDVLECIIVAQSIDKATGVVGFTYGGYEITDVGEEVKAMLEKVELAHARAKKHVRRNMFMYDTSLVQMMEQEEYYRTHLLEAIEKKQLKVYLQRQFNLQEEQAICAEAIVRWVMPNGRIVYPDSFLPYLEENGLMAYLDMYMLENICVYIKKMMSQGLGNICISINLSIESLSQLYFMERFTDIVDKHQVPHEFICMEINEVLFMDQDSLSLRNIVKLKEAGFVVAMDAFASGYSTLRLLPELPVEIIKMDRKFLRGNEKNSKVGIVMESIIELAHKLGMKVTCEGVEHERNLELLQELNCDMIQGYYIAKPLHASEFPGTIEQVNMEMSERLAKYTKVKRVECE